MKVAVIGGGIAGLSTAYYLSNKAKEQGKQISITLIESEDYWGGKIKTVQQDGFVVEGGPDAYLITKPWMKTLCQELGLADGLQGTNPENSQTFILKKGKLTSIPTGLTMTIPTEFGPMIKTRLMNWPQKIRMGFDFIIPSKKENGDESLAGFISRRLGRAAYDSLVGPLLSGIYAGDGDQLSLQSTFPNLREMEIEHGGLIKGALALRKKRARMAKQRSNGNKSPAKHSRSIFETHKSGLNTIVDAIVKKLKDNGVDLRLNTKVSHLEKSESSYQVILDGGETINADALVLATPAYVSGILLEDISPKTANDLNDIHYVTTATVSLAFRDEDLPDPLDGYGYIIPQQEDSKALACTWTSSKWNHRAAKGYALVRVFVGRIQDADTLPTDEDALVELALSEIRQTMGLTAEPVHMWVFRWEKAMPQYNVGHPERLQRIENAIMKIPDLVLAGNGYRGIGMPDCINSGIKAAEKILELSK